MSNPPAEQPTPLASQPHQLQLALEQIDPKVTAKKRPTWWLGMGIVLGSPENSCPRPVPKLANPVTLNV